MSKVQGPRSKVRHPEFAVARFGPWTLDFGLWTFGLWTLDLICPLFHQLNEPFEVVFSVVRSWRCFGMILD